MFFFLFFGIRIRKMHQKIEKKEMLSVRSNLWHPCKAEEQCPKAWQLWHQLGEA
jgi:hypothetical protein